MNICTCKECNQEFQAKTMFAKLCSDKCRMRAYRKTRKGKASYKRYNLVNYKQPEVMLVCQSCGNEFITTYKDKTICNKIKCKNKASYLAQVKSRLKHPTKHKTRDIVSKRIKRGVSLARQSCVVCKQPDAEAHHQDYDKPLEITWLCKQHHEQLHTETDRRNKIHEEVFPLY